MRTERVTLEVTYRWLNPPSKWNWNHVITSPMVTLKEGESVRVVSDEEREGYVASLRADVAKLENDKQFLVERLRPLNDAIPAAFDDNGDRMSSLAALRVLIDERDAAIREREKAVAFWQGELRARTAERDASRARVAELEAASGGEERAE